MSETRAPDSSELAISFEKSNFFRVVHADGCYGGINPRGYIHCNFYSERMPIPRQSVMPIVGGLATEERVTDIRQGIFREVEVDVVMDFNAAISFHIWLKQKLDLMRADLGITDEQWTNLTAPTAPASAAAD